MERRYNVWKNRSVTMVSITRQNSFELRDYLLQKVQNGTTGDQFKSYFLAFLRLALPINFDSNFSTLSLYQRCAISGLGVITEDIQNSELSRLLGQAPRIESTPSPWVSDVFGVMAIKWLVERKNNHEISIKFETWVADFLPQHANNQWFNNYEKDIAAYIQNVDSAKFTTSSIPLFFHYIGIHTLDNHHYRQQLIEKFMDEFQQQASSSSSIMLLAIMVYVFDKANQNIVLTPPNGWVIDDLENFLKHIPVGLKRWTWEVASRTKNANPVKWPINNEYHVQNLLYLMLAPIFQDIEDEVYLKPIGQKTPRIDIYLPSIHCIIEIKYRKNSRKSFQALIGEIAEDVSLYRADRNYKNAKIVSFLWDHTRATEEHAKFTEGLMKLDGLDRCVVISSPSFLD